MPRSSKHKSSRHGSRDAREHSDSERDSGLRDRKGKDESVARVSKGSSSSEKRKLDSKDGKDAHGSGNGEYSDEYGSSKRRKEWSNDREEGGDRWNGGEEERGEGSKKSKATGDSKSSRRDESVGVYGPHEEVKKSSGRGDGKHKESGRRESREGGPEKERKAKEGRSERSVGNEEQRISKHVYENNDSRKADELRSSEFDNLLDRRMRRKREGSGDGDKNDVEDGYDRRSSSRDYIAKDERLKDDKRKDEKYRDKYREEIDRENKHRHNKQRDERPAKAHTSIRSDDKYAREEKDILESQQKRTKLPEIDHDRDHSRDHDGDRDHDLESDHDRERHNEHGRDRDRDRDYDVDGDCDYDRDRDWDWDRDHDRDRDKDHDHERSHVDDRSGRSKENGTKKRTLDDHDDYSDTKSRFFKSHYTDLEKRSSSRADSDVDRGRSQLRQAYADSTGISNKRRYSPASKTHIGKDEHRNTNSDDPKYRDSMIERRTKGSRDGYSGISERGPKYKSMEKPIKLDDGPLGDLSERSSSAKAGLLERSPSSTSIERRYVNKSGVRQGVDIEESARRNTIDDRDFSTSEDRLGRELTPEKPLLDEPPQAESSFYGRTNQGNASLLPPPPAFRAAALDRPFMGSLDDDVRDNSNIRYRRTSDPGFGRGHGNSWRAVPNWTSPVPNGFVSFQPGPAHGGFQTMMPQFASQPLFGVRPPMEINHAGIPYPIPDADRFPGHLRPLGWQNVMDGTGPAHLHGWDSNNGVFRENPHMYGGSDWDRSRHSTNSQGYESGPETWKEQNGDSKRDLPSPACKDESVPAQVDDGMTDQAIQVSQDDEQNQDDFNKKSPETRSSSLSSPAKVPLNSLSTVLEKVPDTSTPSDNASLFSRFYLSKLDISAALVLPELYDQCMCVLNVDKSASNDANASTELFLKYGSRARQIYAATLSRRSPFSAVDNSIFQRAIDLYKKQRVELPNGGKVDIILASTDQVQVDESVPIPSSENRQVSASASDGMADVPISTLEQKKGETPIPAKEHFEEIDQTCSRKEQDHDCTCSLKLVTSSPSSGHGNQGEPVTGLCEKEDEVTSDKGMSGVAEENYPMAFKIESQLAPTLQDGDNMNSKAKKCADENLGFGDTMVNPLIFEDGSPRACDALMPGSNESESLILSRIHHSPESTR